MGEIMSNQNTSDNLRVALAQIAPVWLKRDETISKMLGYIDRAAEQERQLIIFGEAIIPGYPFWVERTDGARFNSSLQKEIFAHYLDQAVSIEAGHLEPLCKKAREKEIAIYTGTIERPSDRGGHSLYCSMVYIDYKGEIKSVHRKLMPTYEERLVWSPGDGHGLRTHRLGAFTVGGLNCWENWMPLARTALYARGEDLHVAIWPGSRRNTEQISRFIAHESRSYVVSVSGLMRKADIPDDIPHAEEVITNCEEMLADGGSCLCGPDGGWIISPVTDREDLMIASIDHTRVREERHNFDPSGHYSRPDVLRLSVNRIRQSCADFDD
jgi:nitrilase